MGDAEDDEETVTDGAAGVDEVVVLAQRFRDFADQTARLLPLYRRLAEGAARDREVAARLLLAHPHQRIPNLLLAAVHDVLLSGDDDPLRTWYASVVPEPRPVGNGIDDPWPAFRRLALEHEGVAALVATRSTQTNEVGRCATLLPALAELAAHAPGAPPGGVRPLGLVELGASAGLNLLLDRYGYRYHRAAAPQTLGSVPGSGDGGDDVEVAADAPLVLTCALRGELVPPLPSELPTIAHRVGVDLHPVDLHDRAAARWLVACQWPDQPERIHRARSAIALAHADAARVVAGDAVGEVAALVDGVPAHALPVVLSTWFLAYLPDRRQRDLLAELDRIGTTRDLSMVFAEQPALVTGFALPPRPDGGADGPATALVRLDWRDGARSGVRLADQHPHGSWLEWLAG